jgi:hypothetical protein
MLAGGWGDMEDWNEDQWTGNVSLSVNKLTLDIMQTGC